MGNARSISTPPTTRPGRARVAVGHWPSGHGWFRWPSMASAIAPWLVGSWYAGAASGRGNIRTWAGSESVHRAHMPQRPYLDFETSISAHTAMEPKHIYIYLRSPQKVLHTLHVFMRIASLSNFTIFGPSEWCTVWSFYGRALIFTIYVVPCRKGKNFLRTEDGAAKVQHL